VEGIVPMRRIKIGALRPELRIFFSWGVHYGAPHVPSSIEKTKQVENYSAAIKDLLRNNSHIFAGRGWYAVVFPNTSGAFLFDGDARMGAAQRISFGRYPLFAAAGTAAQRVALHRTQPQPRKCASYPVTGASDATFRLPDF
jgi:hypothetical protein